MRIAFLVGDIAGISGGSNVVIEHATHLRALGHDVELLSTGWGAASGRPWHRGLTTLPIRSVRDAAGVRYDVALATWWLTFFDLHHVDARVYGYLNQSLESRFHPEPHLKELNRLTYSLPVLFVTEAAWLAELIGAVQPRAPLLYVRNGLSREHFPCVDAVPDHRGPLRVLVEGPWGVPFKGVPETFGALERARESVAFEVGWLTSDSSGERPRVAREPVSVFERVPIADVRGVLGEHDVMVKLSRVEGMYGPPLEMFSQGGTAITLNVTGCDEYVVHGHNGLLVEPWNVGAISGYLAWLDRDRAALRDLRAAALATARAYPGWAEAARSLSDALEALLSGGYRNDSLRPALADVARRASARLASESTWRDRVRASLPWRMARTLVPGAARRQARNLVRRVLR